MASIFTFFWLGNKVGTEKTKKNGNILYEVPLTAWLSACLLWVLLYPFLSCFTWFWRAVCRILSSSCCICCFQRFPFIFYWDWSIYSHFQYPNCLMSWHHNHLRKDSKAYGDIRAPNHQYNRQREVTREICIAFLNREARGSDNPDYADQNSPREVWKTSCLKTRLQILVDSDELSDWI